MPKWCRRRLQGVSCESFEPVAGAGHAGGESAWCRAAGPPVAGAGMVGPEDVDLLSVVDGVEEAVDLATGSLSA